MGREKRKGRPPIPKAKRRELELNVSMTRNERARLVKVARHDGCSVSEILMRPWR